MPSSLLSIEAVSKKFGAFQALHQIDLEVQQGEFIALLGPSGCGKTTLLRTLAGFLHPDAGRILIEGRDIGKLPPHQRPLNTVFQNYALFPHMTVMENVCYGPRRQGMSKSEALKQAQAALAMMGLEGFADRLPRQLSGGQQQRVALARAVVNRPKLLLLDEPLSALDLKLRKRMQLELKQLQNQLGIAFVFVTHDQEEALTMADRIVVMNAGRIEQVGPGDHIYDRPATHFVADFIGEANLLGCHVDESGQLHFAIGGRHPLKDQATVQGDYTAIIRPEHLRLEPASTGRDAPGLRLDVTILDVVNMGSHQMLYVKAGGQALAIRRMGPQQDWLSPGLPAVATLATDDLHLVRGLP
ncbi:MAG: ABC transporter ATP-binding protein [Candidimonas sp.]